VYTKYLLNVTTKKHKIKAFTLHVQLLQQHFPPVTVNFDLRPYLWIWTT